ncbi:hypothetical protein HDU81_006324 [Chytriomyces hyalinus]|nr:hypothetical protein HDU81_006324 [Chytriomyces hyalinus]
MDVAFSRSQFPAIQRNDGSFAFMDNAGGSAVLQSVAERVSDYLLNTNVQLGASYPTSQVSTKLVREGAVAGARFINAASPDEVVLGSSTTQLFANLAHSMEEHMVEGDEIIISETDHEANCGSWARLCKRRNLVLKVWKCEGPDQALVLETLEAMLTPKTRLVTVTHCSNIIGTVNNVKEIAKLVHSIPGAEICVDGVAYASHKIIDVQDLDVDYYCFSWYKVYGPHIAQLYTAKRTFPRLGSINHYFLSPDMRPYIMQPGNLNYELSASLPAIVAYIGDLGRAPVDRLGVEGQKKVRGGAGATRDELERGFQALAAQEHKLVDKFLSYLASKPAAYTVIGEKVASEARAATISFTVANCKSQDFITKLDGYGIGARFGHFYAHRLVCGSLGLSDDGVVRVSMVHYNTVEEVEKLIAAMDGILGA